MDHPAAKLIPEAGLRRLPAYHRVLIDLLAAGLQYVSCSTIARELHLDPTQVRKDIEVTGILGKPKVGYSLPVLIAWIEDFLGWNNTKDAFLAGVGGLGSALIGYEKFRKYGLNLVAAFDTDPAKVGREVHGKVIRHLDELVELALRMHIRIGVIATPAPAAQPVAERMINGGIRAIWNFAPVHLRVPETVIVQNEDLYPSLSSLSYKLERRLKAEREAAEMSIKDPNQNPNSGVGGEKSS